MAILYILQDECKGNEELKEVLDTCLNKDKMSNESCKDLSQYISYERKRKTCESDVKKKVSTIVGTSVAVSIIGIIVKSIIKK